MVLLLTRTAARVGQIQNQSVTKREIATRVSETDGAGGYIIICEYKT